MDKDPARIKWQTELKTLIDEKEWSNIRVTPFTITLNTKLRYFQFRLLSNRLVTNTLRNRWCSNISELCSFCNKDKETVCHLLWTCEISAGIWKNFFKWFNYIHDTSVIISLKIVVLNNYIGQYADLINLCILIAKQYLYACKCLQDTPRVDQLIKRIFTNYFLEKTVATNTNSKAKFYKKWSLFIKSNMLI